jgi:hypothetical protein
LGVGRRWKKELVAGLAAEVEEERMARRKRARSSDSSASGMAGSVLGGMRRGTRRKTVGMETSRSRESSSGEACVVTDGVISGSCGMRAVVGGIGSWCGRGTREDF